jgi:hypothetical protein
MAKGKLDTNSDKIVIADLGDVKFNKEDKATISVAIDNKYISDREARHYLAGAFLEIELREDDGSDPEGSAEKLFLRADTPMFKATANIPSARMSAKKWSGISISVPTTDLSEHDLAQLSSLSGATCVLKMRRVADAGKQKDEGEPTDPDQQQAA